MNMFPGRLGLQQRVLPRYRIPFFDLLAMRCEGGLSVLAGAPLAIEGINAATKLTKGEFNLAKNLYFMDPSSPMYFCWQKGIVDWLEAWDPDTLVIEANPRYLHSLLAIKWMHRREKPVIGWGLGVPRTGNVVERVFRLKFLNYLDGIIAYSKRGVEEYHQLGLKNISLAFNTVAPKPQWEFPDRGIGIQGSLNVLFVGRLQARKRIDILLQACQMLPEPLQPRLVIVGDGPALDELKILARSIYPNTDFVGGVYGGDLAEFFLSADLFALPGTGGLAVQEAMSYGLPIIVAKGDGTQDDLVTTKNGWQVPSGDLNAFFNALKEALSDVYALRRKGEESYRIVSEQVNIQVMLDQFVDAISKIAYS